MALPILPLLGVAALVAIVATRKKSSNGGGGAGMAGEGALPSEAGGGASPTGTGDGARQGLAGADLGGDAALAAILGLGGQKPVTPSAPKQVEWYAKKTDGSLDATPYGKSAIVVALSDYRTRASDASYIDDDKGVEYEGTFYGKAGSQDYVPLADVVQKQRQAGLVLFVEKAAVDEFAAFQKPSYIRIQVTRDPSMRRAQSWDRDNYVLVG